MRLEDYHDPAFVNLLLLTDDDLLPGHRARVSDRRHEHLSAVVRVQEGQTIRAGMVGGRIGVARIVRTDASSTEVMLEGMDEAPPPPLQVQLVLALPRPKVLRRLLRAVTTLGVKDLWLINAARVEKSYFDSPVLEPAAVRRELGRGLEQAQDTVLPTVRVVKRFRPFVEDELPSLSRGTARWAADPQALRPLPHPCEVPATLVIGPETGFDSFERKLLECAGFATGNLGPRILTVETATVAALSRCAPRWRPALT